MTPDKILNNTLKGQNGAPRTKCGTTAKSNKSILNYKMEKIEANSKNGLKTYDKSPITRFIKTESPSKKYAEKYYNMGHLDEGLAADYGMAAIQGFSGSMGMGALTVGAGVLYSAAGAIANLYKQFKWDKRGCDGIVNPEERNQCEARFIDKYISELRSQLKHCPSSKNPNECAERINQEVQQQIAKKNDMFSRYQ